MNLVGQRSVTQVWLLPNVCMQQGVFFGKLAMNDPDAEPHRASDNPRIGKERRERLAAPKPYKPFVPCNKEKIAARYVWGSMIYEVKVVQAMAIIPCIVLIVCGPFCFTDGHILRKKPG
jgi:hypothetical protein